MTDPEAPASTFEVHAEGKRVTQRGVPPVLNPFDENALEAALRIKDAHESKITVISMGQSLSKAVLRKSVAAGADELVLLEDELFDDMDSYATAFTLATAIRKIGKYDLVLTGREAADSDAGVVGSGIAELLGIPSVTVARKVEVNEGKLIVQRTVSDGYEVIETALPALVTVGSELGELRSTALRELMAAQKKPMIVFNAQELGVEPSQMTRTRLLKLSIPHKEERCEIIDGQTLEEAGVNLALKLKESGII